MRTCAWTLEDLQACRCHGIRQARQVSGLRWKMWTEPVRGRGIVHEERTMGFFMKLIGLDGRPDELRDGMLQELVQSEGKPLVAEFYSNT